MIIQLLIVASTLSNYTITIFQDRHSGMDSHQAILPDALWVNANLFQTDLCRNPGSMDGFELTIHGTGYPLPGGYDGLAHNLTK
jgi:hypothetical protein